MQLTDEQKKNYLAMAKGLTAGNESFGKALQSLGVAGYYDDQAALLELDRDQILLDSEYRTKKIEERGESYISTQNARFAKAGVTFSGSVMRSVMKSRQNLREDLLTSRYNAMKQATRKGYAALNAKTAAGNARTRAAMQFGKGLMDMVTSYGMTKYGA